MNFYYKLSTVLLILIGLLGYACNSTSSEEDQDNRIGESLIPLQEGNNWNFQDSEGRQYGSIAVVGTRIVNDEEYYEITIEQSSFGSETIFAKHKDEGTYLGQGTPFAEFPLKYPVEDGEIYTHTDEDGNDYNITVNDSSVTTPAGSFSCLEYNIEVATSGLGGGTVCISPEVGPVSYGNYGTVLNSYNIE